MGVKAVFGLLGTRNFVGKPLPNLWRLSFKLAKDDQAVINNRGIYGRKEGVNTLIKVADVDWISLSHRIKNKLVIGYEDYVTFRTDNNPGKVRDILRQLGRSKLNLNNTEILPGVTLQRVPVRP